MAEILTIADVSVFERVRELLEGEGHSLKVAADSKEGLDLAGQVPPDLIICDGTLPQVGWLELCHSVKVDRALAGVYFILLAAPEQLGGVAQLDELVDDFVLKPIVKQDLLGRVRAGLRACGLRAQLERSQQESLLFRAQIVATEKMSSLGQLVAGIAHEINNPITFIYSNLTHVQSYAADLIALLKMYQKELVEPSREILQKQQDMDVEFVVDDLLKIVNSMRNGSDRIRQIILSVQDFSRTDRSGWQLFDVSDGLENTLLLLQHRLPAQDGRRDIKVVKEYGNLPQVECYAGQLNQAFLSIINNAIDALDLVARESEISDNKQFKPVISIRTKVVDGGRIAIEIADNGMGMSEVIKARIFDPFFTTKPAGEGSGLGLAVSYDIVVQQHKGELLCFSEPGKGTEFRIEIPLRHS
ncbi:MAG: hybrid sensor histidine kinase/response regulator [Oscillatoriaceae cyanobacterium Prado104]|jgi:signal transduction histidine kinase|nr:hybrid sensor histidine kinase/response regulator [Oscillatoriaceae cyanobacterium Prado104]